MFSTYLLATCLSKKWLHNMSYSHLRLLFALSYPELRNRDQIVVICKTGQKLKPYLIKRVKYLLFNFRHFPFVSK